MTAYTPDTTPKEGRYKLAYARGWCGLPNPYKRSDFVDAFYRGVRRSIQQGYAKEKEFLS